MIRSILKCLFQNIWQQTQNNTKSEKSRETYLQLLLTYVKKSLIFFTVYGRIKWTFALNLKRKYKFLQIMRYMDKI